MMERGIIVVLSPDDQDFFRFAFAGEGHENDVLCADVPWMGIGGDNRYAFFGGNHHQDAFHIAGAQQNIGGVTGFLVQPQEKFVAGGIAAAITAGLLASLIFKARDKS